ncbi:MAG: hypothetical protein OXC95_12995 [Dehalococcoidia bacterium]|nr:hypothetical protein [Dehalococcoidia bacterium]
MTKDRKEEVLGEYLATWVDALREGKSIEISDEDLHELTEEQASELMDMARFIKAVNFPTENWQGRSDNIRARLANNLLEKRRKQLSDGYDRVTAADYLGECLCSSRNDLDLSIQEVATTTGIRKPLLEAVETGRLPPNRIHIDRMTELLLRLHLAFDETVDLVKSTSENWTLETFRRNQTQLGRAGRDLYSDEHREAVSAGRTQDLDGEIQRELGRIEEYVYALRQRIQTVAPKS